MSENKEMQVQRLVAIEDFTTVVEAKKETWRNAKERLAQARKDYEKHIDALVNMIHEKTDTPLFDEADDSAEA